MSSAIGRFVFGPPKNVKDPDTFHKLSLVALLAWVGLGADGLSSSAYGPDEAFRALGEHTGLAFFLALATAGKAAASTSAGTANPPSSAPVPRLLSATAAAACVRRSRSGEPLNPRAS